MKNRAISFGVAVILTVGTLVVGAIQPVGASVSAPFDSTFGTDGIARLSLPLQRSNSADGGEPPSAAGFRSPGLSAAGPRLISGHPSLANRLRKCR